MADVAYWHVDAFSAAPFGGNQAAVMTFDVFPDDATMQRIAAENLFAETAFVVPDQSGAAHWRLRWFTPAAEVRLCGHATLAAGHVLLVRDDAPMVRFRTERAGILEVVRTDDGYALALPAIPTGPGEWPAAVSALGGMAPLAIARSPEGYAIFAYEDADAVRDLAPDFFALAELGNWQFICTAPGEDTDIVSRVFVPGAGVDEDSVTGSAHAALTPFWAERLGKPTFSAFQASRRGGHLTCRLEGDTVWLGGPCVTVVEGTFRY